jgi:membrane-associated phospholipid phosphatase
MANVRVLDGITWSLCVILSFIVSLWVVFTDFQFRLNEAWLQFLAAFICIAIRYCYTYLRPDPKIAAILTAVIQILVFTFFGGMLSYLMASLGRPLWDETLLKWDQAIGLDWRAYLDWVNARPLVGLLLTIAYQSIMLQMLILVLLLGLLGRIRDLQVLVAGFVITGLVIVLWSGLMPAMAMFVHLGLTSADYPNLAPAAASVHVGAMLGLRDGTLRDLVPLTFEGIITFPSYHSALGIVFLRAFWVLEHVRWPGAILNIAMIAATPIDGGHYFVDVIAGAVIAGITIWVCYYLSRARLNFGVPVQDRYTSPAVA